MAIGLYNSHPRTVGLLPDAYFERSTEHSQCKTLIVPVNLPVAIGPPQWDCAGRVPPVPALRARDGSAAIGSPRHSSVIRVPLLGHGPR